MGSESLKQITLIEPQNGVYPGFHGLVLTEPLGLECVAGAVSDLAEVQIHDDRIDPGGWIEKIRQSPPDIVGIRCNYTADVPQVRQLTEQIRNEVGKEPLIVVGGHHISLRPEDLLRFGVDVIVVRAGEGPFRELVSAWGNNHSLEKVPNILYKDKNGQFISNVRDEPITTDFEFESKAMDERPRPDRKLVAQYRDKYRFLYYPGSHSLESARGCQFRCTFCSVWQFNRGRFVVESPKRTIEEMVTIADLGGKYVNFVDDLAFQNTEGAMQLANGLIGENLGIRFWAQVRTDNVWPKNEQKRPAHTALFERLAKAGLDMVLVGLESFRKEDLIRVKKGNNVETNIAAIKFLKSIGVRIWGAQIVFPNWDVDDFSRAIDINNELGIEAPQFTILTPLPGSLDYATALKDGFLTTTDPAKFNFFDWTVPTKLPPEKLYEQIARLYKETGSSITDLERIKEDIKAGRTNMGVVREFREKFRAMQDPKTHLAHLAQAT